MDAEEESDSRNFLPPKNNTHLTTLAGQQELLDGALKITLTSGAHTAGRSMQQLPPSAKRQHALTCLGKADERCREDVKKHARRCKCRGKCPQSTNCRDFRMWRLHEFMLRLMCARGGAMQAL